MNSLSGFASPHISAMDRIESLTNTLSNITLYDIKSMYNQVRVFSSKATPQLTFFPGKECCAEYQRNGSKGSRSDQRRPLVRSLYLSIQIELMQPLRGASSTLMQEIAQGYVDDSVSV